MGADTALFGRIRRRLTLWYSGVLAAALVLFGVALYAGVDRALLGPIDDNLATRAHRIARNWQAFPLQRCPLQLVLQVGTYWACFDKNGAPVQRSLLAQAAGPFGTSDFASQALSAGVAHDTVDGGPDIGPIDRYALTVPSANGQRLLGIVEIGENIRGQGDALHTLLALLLVMGPVTFCAATIGGLFLGKSALAPARLAFARQQSFIADASYELRTPLTLLRADAAVLLRGRERLPPDDAELLDDIVAETAHMATLAGNMLTLARLDAERLHIEREVVDLAAVAHAVARRVAALAAATGIVLEEQPMGRALVVGARALLEQAALILVDNTIKYNRPQGCVSLQTCVAARRAYLHVRDSGVGISPAQLARLGERFYRVDKARSREAGGAELGLSIARGIAKAHGGALTLSSVPAEGDDGDAVPPCGRWRAGAAVARPCYASGMEMRALRRVEPADLPPYYCFEELAPDGGIIHAVFTRHGGVSSAPFASLNVSSSIGDDAGAVWTNRDRVLAALGRPRTSLVMAGLVHGTVVARVDAATEGEPLDGGGRYVAAVDALVTDDPGVTLALTAADCAQVFLVDARRRAVGLAHAGWRGTAAGVLTATVEAMQAHFGSDPAELRAAVGPCLGPCCALFSDPHRELPAWCAPFISGQYVDLWAMNRRQLLEAGLQDGAIAVAAVCTVCRRDLFFSHRGDHGRTGRFAAAIGLDGQPATLV